jgi:hypothetical protein
LREKTKNQPLRKSHRLRIVWHILHTVILKKNTM